MRKKYEMKKNNFDLFVCADARQNYDASKN